MSNSSSVYFDGLSDGSSWFRISQNSFLNIDKDFSIGAYTCSGVKLPRIVPGSGLCVGFSDINKVQCTMIADVNGDTHGGVYGGEPALAKLKSSVMAVMAAKNGIIVADIPLKDVVRRSLYSANIKKVMIASRNDYFYEHIKIINVNADRTLLYCEKTKAHTSEIDRRFQVVAFDNGVAGVSKAGERWNVGDAWKSIGISTQNNYNGHVCENTLENHHSNIRLLKAEDVEPGRFFGYFLVNNERFPDHKNYQCSTSIRVEPVKYYLETSTKELTYHTCQSCYEAPTVCLPQGHNYYYTRNLPQIFNVTTNGRNSTDFCVEGESTCDPFKVESGLTCQYTEGNTTVTKLEGVGNKSQDTGKHNNGSLSGGTATHDKGTISSTVIVELAVLVFLMVAAAIGTLYAIRKVYCVRPNAGGGAANDFPLQDLPAHNNAPAPAPAPAPAHNNAPAPAPVPAPAPAHNNPPAHNFAAADDEEDDISLVYDSYDFKDNLDERFDERLGYELNLAYSDEECGATEERGAEVPHAMSGVDIVPAVPDPEEVLAV